MKPSAGQLEALFALKRLERPEEGYWQDFLCEFHQRQREQAAKKPGMFAWVGQVTEWFSHLGPSKWAYSAGLAYAMVMLVSVVLPKQTKVGNPTIAPVNYQVVPAAPPAIEQLDQLDLAPSTKGSTEDQVF